AVLVPVGAAHERQPRILDHVGVQASLTGIHDLLLTHTPAPAQRALHQRTGRCPINLNAASPARLRRSRPAPVQSMSHCTPFWGRGKPRDAADAPVVGIDLVTPYAAA